MNLKKSTQKKGKEKTKNMYKQKKKKRKEIWCIAG